MELVELLQAVQAGGSVATVAIAAYLVRLDRRVLKLELIEGIRNGSKQGQDGQRPI